MAELDDDDLEEWIEDEGDPDDVLMECPACRKAVHEDAQQCPHCGDWIIPVDPVHRGRRSLWSVLIVLVILLLVLITMR